MKKILLALFFIIAVVCCKAQIGLGVTNPHPNAYFQINSTNKGVLLPRMTAVQRIAIAPAATANGLIVFDTDSSAYMFWTGSVWEKMGSGDGNWIKNGNNIYNSNFNTGFVGIGTNSPLARLQVTDSTVVFTGPLSEPAGGNLSSFLQGAGTRLLWHPQKAALRAGYVNGNQWNNDSIGLFSFATGYNTKAVGDGAVSLGRSSIARGFISSAIGFETVSDGFAATALGSNTYAGGYHSLAAGRFAVATGSNSFSMGEATITSGTSSAAIGTLDTASGNYAFATGFKSKAEGLYSFAAGNNAKATQEGAVAIGTNSIARGINSTAIGFQNLTDGYAATALGGNTFAGGYYSLATGHFAAASGLASFSMGESTIASGTSSTAIGTLDTASGNYAFATGFKSKADGLYSFAAGNNAKATQEGAIAIGTNSIARGINSTAIGFQNLTDGYAATALGGNTYAGGNYSLAAGRFAVATGSNSFSMGEGSIASGTGSAAIGLLNTASGNYAFATGENTRAAGLRSFSMGQQTIAKAENSLVIGQYNDTTATNSVFEIGNGISSVNRSNAVTVLKNGYVGIGTTTPVSPLSFASSVGNKIALWGNDPNNHYGMGIQGSLLQIYSASVGDDIGFGYGSSTNFIEGMRIKGNGNVGIGNDPSFKLHVGDGTLRVEGPQNQNSGIKAMSIGGYGDVEIDKPGVAGGRMVIKEDGNVGIGNTNPGFLLDLNGRMRIRSGGLNSSSAGIWLNNNANNVSPAFVGMESDDAVGFFGSGVSGFSFTMNTNTGKIKIADGTQADGRVLTSDANGIASWVPTNSNKLAVNATFPSYGIDLSSSAAVYTNLFIDLPPGKWLVMGTYTLSQGGISLEAGQSVFVRTSFSSSPVLNLATSDIIGSGLISGHLSYPTPFAVMNGQNVVNNTSGGNKRYYVWASIEKTGSPDPVFFVKNLCGDFWLENNLVALPMN